jgi:hypothetical protein
MSLTTRIAWETLRSFNSASLSGSYQAVGTPLLHPSYILKMVNNATTAVTVSIDGLTDIDVLPADSFFLYDETKFGIPSIQFLPQNTQIFVKGTAGVGTIYLVSQYIVQG